MGLELNGFSEYMAKLDKVGGSPAMKKGAETALQASKEYINRKLEDALTKSNLPAGGKYSKGGTKGSINTDKEIQWEAFIGATKVGFNFKESGLKSIVLMYGTPKMKPVKGLKDAIYGNATKKAITKIQEDELSKVLKDIMEGK